jgi:hypothetical protein
VPELLQPHHSSFQYHHSNHVEASGQDRRECPLNKIIGRHRQHENLKHLKIKYKRDPSILITYR